MRVRRLAAPEALNLRYRRLWLALGAGFLILVVYLSLGPAAPDLGKVEDVKLGHLTAYFWLMVWFGQIVGGRARQLAVAVALVALGVVLEYLQGLTGYRTFAYVDMAANAIGVAIGWIVVQTPARRALAKVERRLP